jgi:excisionase family DNA binding protein
VAQNPLPSVSLLVTPEEAARVLRISRSKIYELISSRELKSVQIGRSRRIRWGDLQAFVDNLAACAA